MSRREGVEGSESQICYLQLPLMMMMVIMLEILWREGGEGIQGNGCRQGRKVPAKREKNRIEKVLQLS